MRTFVRFATLVLLALVCAETSSAQSCTPAAARTWIAINDNGSGRDTLWFGQDISGSYGLNTPLCEIELPPPPPTGVFDARFVNINGRDGLDTPAGLGQGFKQDYRGFGPDTFKVKFQPSDAGFPVTFSWNIFGVLSVCDSALLQDEFGGVIFKVRMHRVNQYTFASPAFTSALLILWPLIEDVEEISQVPQAFGLSQNYPNPFNPSTRIVFGVESRQSVSLKVYDMLGQEVATLVNEDLMPGSYSATLDAVRYNLSSGVYYYRLSAGEFVQTNKMILQK